MKEQATHKTISIIRKYDEIKPKGMSLKEFEALYQPVEVRKIEGNALIEAGVDVLWALVCGDGGATSYGGANDTIEVYIVDTWDAGTADGDYPTYGSDGKATWKASWTGSDGDGVWSKWAVTNGAQHLNEKTEALGTKSGGTWTLEVSITIS